MSLLSGAICLQADERTFFHCKKDEGGCGHISHTAKTKLDKCRMGPISADAAAWVATYCMVCGKQVQSETH